MFSHLSNSPTILYCTSGNWVVGIPERVQLFCWEFILMPAAATRDIFTSDAGIPNMVATHAGMSVMSTVNYKKCIFQAMF